MNCSTEEDLVVQFRLEKLREFKEARKAGNSVKASLRSVGVPKTTLYRWRKDYKLFGEAALRTAAERVRRRRRRG